MKKKHTTFQKQVDTAQKKLQALEQRAQTLPAMRRELVGEALEELSFTLEELRVSAEEMRQMNDQLAEAGRVVEAERMRFQELFDFAPDGYLETDVSGIIREGNRAAESLLNRRRDFLVGKPLSIWVAKPQRKDFRALLSDLQTAGSKARRDLEFCLNLPRGKTVEAALTVAAVHNEGGRVKALRWLLRDNTERKRAEKEIKQIQAALNRRREIADALASQLLMAQEDERRRVSRELHDDLNQKLALLAVEVESLERSLPSSRGKIRESLLTLRDRVIELSDNVHALAYGLHPSILDDLGLAVAIKSYVEDFSRREKIDVRYSQRKVPQSIQPEIATCLYRVMQEALRNVAKHSRAQRSRVSLLGSETELRLFIMDNGVGFDLDALNENRIGLGIASMQERVRLVNGTFSMKSVPRRGTQIHVRVPLMGD
jgi:PAS domain S-box-containing protein